jgi:hypothetical protein
MNGHLEVHLSLEDVKEIHEASPLHAVFPMNFFFNFRSDQPYHTGMTAKDKQ